MTDIPPAPAALLVVNEASTTGAPRSALETLRALAACGWDVVSELIEGGPLVSAFQAASRTCAVVEARGVDRLLRSCRWRGSSLGLRRELATVGDRMAGVSPSLVVGETIVAAGYVVTAARLGIPAILILRENPSVLERFWRAYRLGTPPPKVTIIANSASTADVVARLAGRQVDAVIPPPVDVPRRTPDLSQELAQRQGPHVIGVGRVGRVKGVDIWLEVIAQLRRQGRLARGTWIGPGRERWAQRRANRLGIRNAVTFTGSVEDPYPLMAAGDLLLVPSRAEPFSRVIVEGLGLGLPIVASSVGGIPEALGDAGRLVPPGDVGAMVAAVRSIDEADVARARRDGPRRAENFTAARYRERLGPYIAR